MNPKKLTVYTRNPRVILAIYVDNFFQTWFCRQAEDDYLIEDLLRHAYRSGYIEKFGFAVTSAWIAVKLVELHHNCEVKVVYDWLDKLFQDSLFDGEKQLAYSEYQKFFKAMDTSLAFASFS